MKLKEKEERIIRSLRAGNALEREAFQRLLERFAEDDEMYATCHAGLIRAIYLNPTDNYIWQLAVNHYSSESTIYRYRKEYLAWFHYYADKLAKTTKS